MYVSPPLAKYREAGADTREAFDAAAKTYWHAPPPAGARCSVCGHEDAIGDVLISYQVPTPMPYCSAPPDGKGKGCAGMGWAEIRPLPDWYWCPSCQRAFVGPHEPVVRCSVCSNDGIAWEEARAAYPSFPAVPALHGRLYARPRDEVDSESGLTDSGS